MLLTKSRAPLEVDQLITGAKTRIVRDLVDGVDNYLRT